MIDFNNQILNTKDPLALAKATIKAGFNKIIASSNCTFEKDSIFSNEYNMNKCEYLKKDLKNNSIDLEVILGNEINNSPEVLNLLATSKISTINGTGYILLKFEEEECDFYSIIDTAFQLEVKGYRPIITQIESYDCVIEDPTIVKDLIRRDIILQLDILSIIGANGKKMKKTAKTLLKQNLIHILGTNIDKPEDYKKIPTALKKIRRIVGKTKFEEITTTNGELILQNEVLQSTNTKETKKKLFKFKTA